MIVNPFTFGNPIKDPSRFYGREQEIRQIVGRLLSPAFESTALVGERRLGKTSLLTYLANPKVAADLGLSSEQYVLVYLDFQGCTDITPQRFWDRVLRRVARALADEELATLVKELGDRSEIDQYDLEDLFLEIEDRGLKIVLLIDELEYVTQNPNFDVDFFSGLRALAIHCPLALVTATRQELVTLCHSDAIKGSPFFNIFANVVLRPFEREEAEAMIDGELSRVEVVFSEGARAHVLQIAGDHPMFVQMTGYYCFDGQLQGLEGDALREYVERSFGEQAAPHFQYMWTHSEESERITMLALLVLAQGKRPPTRKELLKSYPRAKYALADLAKRGLIQEDGEQVALFSPLFGSWLLAEMGTATESDEQTVDKWLEERGGIDHTAWDRVKRSLPRVKPEYWLLMREFVTSTTAEIAAGLVMRLGGM